MKHTHSELEKIISKDIKIDLRLSFPSKEDEEVRYLAFKKLIGSLGTSLEKNRPLSNKDENSSFNTFQSIKFPSKFCEYKVCEERNMLGNQTHYISECRDPEMIEIRKEIMEVAREVMKNDEFIIITT